MLGRLKNNLLFWQLTLLVIVVAIGMSVDIAHRNDLMRMMPESRFNPTSYNNLGSGYKGLYEVCRKLGYRVNRWERPYRYLSDDRVSALLIIVTPAELLSTDDTERLLHWVARGNSVIYLDFFGFVPAKKLLNKLHLTLKPLENRSDDTEILLPPSGWGEHVGKVVVRADARFSGGESVISDSFGNLLVEKNYGKGRILIGACPSLGTNTRFAKRVSWGNIQLLSNWIASCGKRAVFFDEYCHGISRVQSVFAVFARSPGGLAFVQLMVLLAVAVAGSAQRFGAMKNSLEYRTISNLEFVSGMSATFKRARANSASWSILFAAMKHSLVKGLGCSPDENLETMAMLWAQYTGLAVAECLDFLRLSTNISSNELVISDEELLALNQQAQKLMAASGDIFKPRRLA